jgi:hypothetical protein
LEFTLQDNQKDMVDLVVSNVKDQQSTTAGGKVTFAFKHALTRVAMHAKTSVATNAETKVYITGIKLKHTKKLAQKATFDMNDATWELPATTPGSDYLAAEYAIAATSANGVLKLANPAWKGYTTPAVEINSAVVNLFTDDQYLFFIPIDGTTGTGAASDVVAAISYDIVSLPSSGATTAVASSFTKEVDLGANVFAKGKAYKFTFTITIGIYDADARFTCRRWYTVLQCRPVGQHTIAAITPGSVVIIVISSFNIFCFISFRYLSTLIHIYGCSAPYTDTAHLCRHCIP